MISRPLRVLHWTWQAGSGGIDRVVDDLVRAQAGDPGLAPRRLVGRGEGETARMRHGFDFGRLGALRRAVAEADLVHFHGYNPVVAAAVRAEGRPCVYTDHGSDRHRSLRNLIVLHGLQRRFVRARPGVVTVNSRFRQRSQAEFYGLEPERVRVVYNGLDFGAIRAARNRAAVRAGLGLPPDAPVVGTVAVFQARKRIHLLLEAFARSGVDGRLVVVGDGALRPRLERCARELGLGDRTLFTGLRRDAYDLMAAMDVFVLPTEGEPFGLAALEALALRRPAVVWRDGGGVVEVVRDGVSGFVVANAGEAAARLRELCASPDLRARLGEAGAADVRERFSLDAMARGMRACYEDVLSRPARRAP